ncbi:type II secretion system protein E (GspE) [Hephaestia caeni]|uniref:Type II secretion system protein E (GspE) n=1 Tax=Hephaestia caeni TaxID=645617 RepID=A0A397PD39_9SPHN|nr:ATPase, T2SS/T4P/T4SS family [Hephaestia caeni]RIA46323.1 type II secretion system protein E (GspE) [Hephaestia caeni]
MGSDSMFPKANIERSWHKVQAPPTTEEAGDDAAQPHGFEAMLRARASLSEDSLQRALLICGETGERLDSVVTRLGMLSEDRVASEMAAHTGLPVVDGSALPAQAVEGPDLSVDFLRGIRALPIAADEAAVRVAVSDPFDPFVEKGFRFMFGRSVERVIARASDIDAAIERLYHGTAATTEETDGEIDSDDLERLKDLVSDAPVIRAVNRLIARASDERASDIHIEPNDDGLAIRFRVDGMLRESAKLPVAMRAPLVSRIKVMAGLNIAERRLPQDGRLRISVRGHEIDLRVATAPGIHGESVVMRILDRSKLALDFVTLGFDADLTARMREAVARPHGIVLVTGPTGSGKTTTLYAALSELNVPYRKLLTVEDPIEYRLPGVTQTQVNPAIGFTFSTALRSFLRQDPDVMMVGEIRDTETAQIAVQAALTGHMILSTLHTNTAAGAVSRLLDMGVEPFLLGSVLTGILAQRLVRRLCTECRRPYDVTDGVPDILRPLLHTAGAERLFHAVGCERCGGSGYAGRVAILEFLRVDDPVSRLILHRADTPDIQAAGEAGGMRSLLVDGVSKAAVGLTTVEEVLRVASGDG